MLQKLMLALVGSKVWSWLLLKVLPYLRFSMYYTRFKGRRFVQGYKILAPGQFVLTLDEHKITSMLVPGFMTHAGFVVGNALHLPVKEVPYEVAEMTHDHFTKSYFFDVCKESSRVLICDCLDWDFGYVEKMLANLPRLEKAKYDVGFSLGVELLYCSELIYQLDRMANNPEANLLDLRDHSFLGRLEVDLSDIHGLGQRYISPDGLLFAKNTTVVWDSDGELDGMTGPEAREFCKEKKLIK